MASPARDLLCSIGDSSIMLNVVVPCLGIRVISIVPSERVASLHAHFPRQRPEFIFRGQLLNPHETLSFYNIRDNDSLVLISQAAPSAFSKEKWMSATRESDEFDVSVRTAMNRDCRTELLRLRDLQLLRMECRPRTFRKVSNSVKQMHRCLHDGHKTVLPGEPTMRCDPLPFFW
jgi:hypothetical protein